MEQSYLVARWLNGDIPGKLLPWQIDIDTSNICNQACYYCNSEQFRMASPTYQRYEKYMNLIDKLYQWRQYDPLTVGTISNMIYSGGGEPTLLPNFDKLLEKTIDYGFSVSMNTNGTKLNQLFNIPASKLRKMGYIGLDIDSANPKTYEDIRRSKITGDVFSRVKNYAKELGKENIPIDIKALLMPQNTTSDELKGLVEYAKEVNARSIHFRPVVLDNTAFKITDEIQKEIDLLSKEYSIEIYVAKGRYIERQYSVCHQMFLFPSFSADGYIYLCCEYKGRKDLQLCSWLDDKIDWRDIWGSAEHMSLYSNFKTTYCKPCRPNLINNNIQSAIDNPHLISQKTYI